MWLKMEVLCYKQGLACLKEKMGTSFSSTMSHTVFGVIASGPSHSPAGLLLSSPACPAEATEGWSWRLSCLTLPHVPFHFGSRSGTARC